MLAFTFTDQAVYILEGETKGALVVSAANTAVFPAGAMDNGSIQDFETVRRCVQIALEQKKMHRKSARICVVSTQISTSEYVLPYTKKEKELETMLRAEASQLIEDSNYIADYIVQEIFEDEGKKKCRVSVHIVPKALVDGYRSLLGDLGIRQIEFDVVKSAVTRIVHSLAQQGENTLLAYADEKQLMLFLPSSASNMLVRQFPLDAAGGMPESELAAQIIRMVQFREISAPGSHVDQIYLLGSVITEDLLSQTQAAVGIPVSSLPAPTDIRLPADFEINSYILPLMTFSPAKKKRAQDKEQINFFNSIRTEETKAHKKLSKGVLVYISITTVLTLASLSVLWSMYTKYSTIRGINNDIDAYINDPAILASYDELTSLQQETVFYRDYTAMIQEGETLVSDHFLFDLSVYRTILSQMPARVSLTALIYENDTLAIHCVTDDNLPPADFAENLDTCGKFSSVRYIGFSTEKEQIVFTIVCG